MSVSLDGRVPGCTLTPGLTQSDTCIQMCTLSSLGHYDVLSEDKPRGESPDVIIRTLLQTVSIQMVCGGP